MQQKRKWAPTRTHARKTNGSKHCPMCAPNTTCKSDEIDEHATKHQRTTEGNKRIDVERYARLSKFVQSQCKTKATPNAAVTQVALNARIENRNTKQANLDEKRSPQSSYNWNKLIHMQVTRQTANSYATEHRQQQQQQQQQSIAEQQTQRRTTTAPRKSKIENSSQPS